MGPDPASASLAPGFRFHPTDEELVRYYLRRKVCGKPFRFDAISEIDIYKSEPWDLPGKSRLKSRDLEWYFFSMLDKKYGNGSRTNRATERGYWKTTGKDRPVLHNSRTVGMKKTLVYHSGRAPRGERSNWVMHEYRLVDEQLENSGIFQDAFVLCRIFQKSGTGPKNGEQYGAPFVEEEWEDDELVTVPSEQAAEEVAVSDDAYLDGIDLEQILDAEIPAEDVPLPLSFYYGDDGNQVQEPVDFVDDAQKLLVATDESYCVSGQPDDQMLFDLPAQTNMDTKPVRHEYIGEPSNAVNSVDVDYLLDEPFMDAISNTPFDEGLFLETNDLSNPIEADPSSFGMLEDYRTYFDADGGNSQFMAFDSSKMTGSVDLVSGHASLAQKHEGSQQLLKGHDDDVVSTSKQEPGKFGSDTQYPFVKHASRMLGNIPAPPAFASEFPSKDAVVRLNSTSHSSSSVHFTTGMIQIRNMTLNGNGTYPLLGKHTDVNIILSFGISYNDSTSASLDPMSGMLLGKAGSSMTRGWFYLIFFWVLLLSMSYKIGTCLYTGNAS
ncbi:NAC domain-containing protein 78-like [Camellia sinensis]|uniref:NAC domain-containing protein 78-like n=1 Tax=Camellia sinensis TaxID=4442 RepID=UPI001035B4CE|nr:NAC domain-containing protein 78-like [Camellia sinensis]